MIFLGETNGLAPKAGGTNDSERGAPCLCSRMLFADCGQWVHQGRACPEACWQAKTGMRPTPSSGFQEGGAQAARVEPPARCLLAAG